MKRAPLVLLALTMGLFLIPSVASAQNYPPDGTTLTVRDSTINAGGLFSIGGGGFRPGSTVTIRVGGVVVGTATVNASGEFTFTGTLPKGLSGGSSSITATGLDSAGAVRGLTSAVTILPLGATGLGTGGLLLVALGALLLGGLALAFSRRDSVRV